MAFAVVISHDRQWSRNADGTVGEVVVTPGETTTIFHDGAVEAMAKSFAASQGHEETSVQHRRAIIAKHLRSLHTKGRITPTSGWTGVRVEGDPEDDGLEAFLQQTLVAGPTS